MKIDKSSIKLVTISLLVAIIIFISNQYIESRSIYKMNEPASEVQYSNKQWTLKELNENDKKMREKAIASLHDDYYAC